jgi:hypothetical protein
VEFLEVVAQWRRDRATRRRLGMPAGSGQSAFEERMRLYAAQHEEPESGPAHP